MEDSGEDFKGITEIFYMPSNSYTAPDGCIHYTWIVLYKFTLSILRLWQYTQPESFFNLVIMEQYFRKF